VQAAWSNADLQGLRRLVTPEMLVYFAEELANNTSQGVQNRVEQVTLLNGDLREAWDEAQLQYATAHLRWSAVDYTLRTDRGPGDADAVVEGDPLHPVIAEEMWTFARAHGGHWLLSAIQQV
jgi:predicted lipid-binding transport protein (Tim44 family)